VDSGRPRGSLLNQPRNPEREAQLEREYREHKKNVLGWLSNLEKEWKRPLIEDRLSGLSDTQRYIGRITEQKITEFVIYKTRETLFREIAAAEKFVRADEGPFLDEAHVLNKVRHWDSVLHSWFRREMNIGLKQRQGGRNRNAYRYGTREEVEQRRLEVRLFVQNELACGRKRRVTLRKALQKFSQKYPDTITSIRTIQRYLKH
jgi:hypothetical protein